MQVNVHEGILLLNKLKMFINVVIIIFKYINVIRNPMQQEIKSQNI